MICSGNLLAQQYYFDNYSVQHGLAQSTVYDIFQDNKGYLWLGTGSGVSRFNGLEFKNYSLQDGFAEGAVRQIIQDKSGALWFGHTGGALTKFYQDSVTVYEFDTLAVGNDVTGFLEDDKGRLWVSFFRAGLLLIEKSNKKTIQYKQFKSAAGLSDQVFGIEQLSDGRIYAITDIGLKFYDSKENNFKSYENKKLPKYFQITCFLEDEEKNVWFGTYHGGLYKYISATDQLETYDIKNGLKNNWVSTLAEDHAGNIWVGTWGGGLSCFEKNGIIIYSTENGLQDNKIRSLKVDREGNVLIGTNENGLLIFKGKQFVSYSQEDGLVNDQVWAVHKSGDELWFGTSAGISVYNQQTGKIKNHTRDKGLYGEQIRYIKEDKNGTIWVGTNDAGVLEYRSGRFQMNSIIGSYMNYAPTVTAMTIDHQNNLWVGTIDGLVYYEIDRAKAARLSNVNGLSGNDISALFVDSKGLVWVGAKRRGLTSINDTVFTKVDLGVINFTPTSIAEDAKGRLWIGTDAQGVLIVQNNKVLAQLDVKKGLSNNNVSLVLPDASGNVWIGTTSGLNKYVESENKIYSYSEKDGFVGIEIKQGAGFKDEHENIWLGTVHGVIKNVVKEEKKNTLAPLVAIESFKVNHKKRTLYDGLTLSHSEKSLVFDFNAICLSNSEALRYQVMLVGADEDWKMFKTKSAVEYPLLPSGEYIFKLKAMNNDGVWSEALTYKIIIHPPFWKTWWFLTMSAILALLVVFMYIKTRERRLIKEKEILEDTVQQRTKEVVLKNAELDEKNKEITSSIRYAKRIQDAVLPPDEIVKKVLKENYFVLYKPKDIVSGDFYWVYDLGDEIMFAAVDCTGHGVPGAFMSIIGHNLLDRIVGEQKITEPGKVLDALNKGVSDALRQTHDDEAVRDGMDIAICRIRIKENKLDFAGAYNPLWILKGNEIIETKGDKFAIGNLKIKEEKHFTNHTFDLDKSDRIYIFSDGFADQFGGSKGKKFKYKPFKDLLIERKTVGMEDQKALLNDTIDEWMGAYEQIDDILIIGFEWT